VSGAPDAWFPGVDFAFVPIRNPAIVAVPVSFLLGFLATIVTSEGKPNNAEMEVRALTGIGAA
jgi:cation/acetate symporter